VINDSVASLTALAAANHRNTTWPEKAVREASNLTAEQALQMNVIDFIAPTLPALLDKLDGYKTKNAQRPFTLHLAGAEIDTVKPGFITRFLNTIINPNLISLLFLLGIVGLIFEVLHPGVVLPGALGAVSLVLALYGFSVLRPSWGGLALDAARNRAAGRRPPCADARCAHDRRASSRSSSASRSCSRTNRASIESTCG
jgi:membrane-bound serine protease (ClpP class)